jgi:5-histidylcysteine sulfoxide synthase
MKHLKTNNISLDGTSVIKKREEILDYYIKTYQLYERLFDIFVNDNVFYEQPEGLRHPLVFYFGHTAIFYINKLYKNKSISKRVNSSYEKIFAIGVDEMSWDDLNQDNYDWPAVNDVRQYRKQVKEVVINYITNVEFTLPITWDNPMWVILMACEHERIHIETSSVLHRQLDIKYVKENSFFNECSDIDHISPPNKLISFDKDTITLGCMHEQSSYYAWDNEYGKYIEETPAFKASKYLVSNQEYLTFVNDDGYSNDSYWSKEGLAWKNYTKAQFPNFWIKKGLQYYYRNLTNETRLPLSFPVDVNYLEAEAFCKYKSMKENKIIVLPSEAMWYKMKKESTIQTANYNLEQFTSSCPVDLNNHGELYDVVGNVWQWTSTHFDKFEGFKIHEIYDDFSVPTFDTKHNVIKGGSWISTGNLISHTSRYAFRRHFFQHSGFRYVEL